MSSNGGALGIGSESPEVEDYTVHEMYKEERKPSSSEPSGLAEKGEVALISQEEDEDDHAAIVAFSHEEQFPIDPNAEEETHQFTIRAVLVGCCLGGVIAASKLVILPSLMTD